MRPPTIIEVAAAAGVSKATVSRVLRNQGPVSNEARQAVLRAVHDVGYTPNRVARSLKERVSSVIGVVVADLANPYYVDVIHGIHQAADEAGQQVIIVSGHQVVGGEEAAIETLLEFRVSGIILASTNLPMATIGRLTKGLPVAIEGRSDTPAKFDLVTSDDHVGGRLIIDHLVSLGHQRIALLEDDSPSGKDRKDAFTAALRASQLASQARHATCPSTSEGGHEAVTRLLRRGKHPTAIACADDVIAIGAMSALQEAGLSIPDEVSVTGFDDIGLASLRQFDLTTVRQERWEIGRRCLQLVHRRAQDDTVRASRSILQPRLVIRGSTAPVHRMASAGSPA
ncbi:MAG: LacI family transcriptional regulator [Actinomycetales bacterium]|nr:LacI family transcriptional regulator [Actinomycetales bacterium]